MRLSLTFLLAMPLVGLAMPSSSTDTKATNNNCTLSHCEPAETPATHQPHNLETTSSGQNITSILDVDGPIIAKGGKGGKAGALWYLIHHSAASRSMSNPLSAFRGPILALNSLFTVSRAQVAWGESSEQAAGSELAGKETLVDGPTVAKGGGGGGGGGHGGGGHSGGGHSGSGHGTGRGKPVLFAGGASSSAASRSVSNPLSALRRPILVLTSLFYCV